LHYSRVGTTRASSRSSTSALTAGGLERNQHPGQPMTDQILNSVAVVGMAGRFPGAESIDEYWRNLVAGAESVSFFTSEELAASGVNRGDLDNPDYVRARGLLKDPEWFDADFFGIGHREAELMDPQHRLFLETCWHALEHSAIAPSTFAGLIGVWAGLS